MMEVARGLREQYHSTVLRMSQIVRSEGDVDSLINSIITLTYKTIPAERVTMFLVDDIKQELWCKCVFIKLLPFVTYLLLFPSSIIGAFFGTFFFFVCVFFFFFFFFLSDAPTRSLPRVSSDVAGFRLPLKEGVVGRVASTGTHVCFDFIQSVPCHVLCVPSAVAVAVYPPKKHR